MEDQPIQKPIQHNNHSLSTEDQERVGIKCYISKGGPILAITKYMLTDFIVNEIDKDCNVVAISSKPDYDLKTYKQKKPQINYAIDQQLRKQIEEVLGVQCAKEIQEMYTRLQSGEKVNQWNFVIENIAPEKDKRQAIHNFIREKLHHIESNTLQGHKMKLKFNKKIKKLNPALRNKYTYFTLFKSNIDTMGALFKLSKITGINQKLFSSAGLKDKRGVTTQLISVYNTQTSSLKKFYQQAERNKEMWIENIQEGKETDIGVGDLWGNQFSLILRLINPEETNQIEQRIKSLKNIGMINYFGMQRFGTCGTKTHMIGVLIVLQKWKELIEELLLEKTRDNYINQIKQQCYESQQYAKGERSLPNRYKIEKNIFRGLVRYGANFQNVFESLPRSIRTLYCHSLQSYIWNRMVSKRIDQYGLQLQVGDLVGNEIKGFNLAKMKVEEMNEGQKNIKQEKDQQINQEEILLEEEERFEAILITKQNIDKYSINDVIFPLYGPSLEIPEQSLAVKFLQEELADLDLTEDSFKKNSKQLCFKGQYRKMLVKPKQVDYKIISHQQIRDELQNSLYMINQDKKIEGGALKSVQLIIQLPKSSYATMAIRQVLHVPSSFNAQMHLNRLYQAKQQKKYKEDEQKKQKKQASDKKQQ